ncbi:MAG: hypothetical protein NVS3B24_14650 [Candidatus Dormibacteria bacterium]
MSSVYRAVRKGGGAPTVPQFLHLQRVPLRVVLITGAISYSFLIGAVVMGYPLWGIALAAMLPWLPVVLFEELWKYEHYGFLAVFAAVTFLQAGHMMEHVVQLAQLYVGHGDMARAHGVFGQLDVEAVHTSWDVGIWLAVCVLVVKFGRQNPWLWITLVAVSLHSVEHVYIAWILQTDPAFYAGLGKTGLLATGGVIGSPLPRIYLHFLYNAVVTLALGIALWEQTRIAYDEFLAKALPDLRGADLVTTSSRLRRLAVEPGEVVYTQGQPADSLYVLSHGLLETVRDGSRIALLQPGHFFGETGLMTGHPRRSTVRALEHSELLVLGREGFNEMVTQSAGARADLEAAMASSASAS